MAQQHRFSTSLLIMVIALVLTACGGGGSGGGSQNLDDTTQQTQPRSTSVTISGAGVKGPMSGATVRFYEVDTTQPLLFNVDEPVGITTTRSDGTFNEVILNDGATAPFIVVADGRSAIDIHTGRTPVIPELVTIVSAEDFATRRPIYATPLTTLTIMTARLEVTTGANPTAVIAAVDRAALEVRENFGFGLLDNIDIMRDPPMLDQSMTTPESQRTLAMHRSAVEAVSAVIYSMVQTGVNNESLISETAAESIIAAMARDLAHDGVADGHDGSTVLPVVDATLFASDPSTLMVPDTDISIADIGDIIAIEAELQHVDVTLIDRSFTVDAEVNPTEPIESTTTTTSTTAATTTSTTLVQPSTTTTRHTTTTTIRPTTTTTARPTTTTTINPTTTTIHPTTTTTVRPTTTTIRPTTTTVRPTTSTTVSSSTTTSTTAPSTTTTTLANHRPLANAGADNSIVVGTLASLNGSGSSDVDNDALTYRWSLTTQPTGSSVALRNSNTAMPSFTPTMVGHYIVSLTVNDGILNSVADTITINATTSGGGRTPTTYYVDREHTLANDANPGTTVQPFLTISRAAQLARAGDKVIVKSGTYLEAVDIANSGTLSQPITFAADANVIVDPPTRGAWTGAINVEGKTDIVITGFTLRNGNNGIKVDKDGADNPSERITIKNNYVTLSRSSGIRVAFSRDVIVDSNVVEKTNWGGIHEMISIINTDGFVVKNNEVFNGDFVMNGATMEGKEGIDAKQGSRNGVIMNNVVHDIHRLGIYVDAWNVLTHNIEVIGNVVYNCKQGISISSETGGLLKDILVSNNVLYNNRAYGIIVPAWVGDGPRENIRIINNTVYGNTSGGINVATANVYRVEIQNNIIANNGGPALSAGNIGTITKSTNNLVVGRNTGNILSGTLSGDPRFVNAAAGNFQLSAGSAAINSGVTIADVIDDIDGTPRPSGGAYDLGAFEMP